VRNVAFPGSAGAGAQRPLSAVPRWLLGLLAAALAAQIGWRAAGRFQAPGASDLPAAPSAAALRLASLGETAALSRVAMLWLQAFDYRSDNTIRYQQLDYTRLIAWLGAIFEVDPRSRYPLFAAARVYAENDDARKARQMFDFVEAQFLRDPNARWAALAHVALLAKHRLHDLPLALRYASEIQRLTTDPTIPSWAKQMEVFILEDMNELEAAKVMLGGLLATGRIHDPEEQRFLQGRLEEIERRLSASQAPKR
jgi:hypothetical protein